MGITMWTDEQGRNWAKLDAGTPAAKQRKRSLVRATEFLRLAGKENTIPYLREYDGKKQDGITEAQRNCLHNLGIGYSEIRCKGNAMEIIGLAIDREKKGLATAAQMRLMEEMGVSKVHIRTKKEAAFIISGGEHDVYSGLLIIVHYDVETIKNCKLTARSRREAKTVTDLVHKLGGTNIRYTVKECE